jgi:DNA uptake protein ComE-like DNA-binding protein
MQLALIRTAAIAAALALSFTVAMAADTTPQAPAAPAAKAKPAEKGAKAKSAKAAERPVDINRASKAQLMKLPGIDDALAAKIVEGRPYRTKAELVTRSVIPAGTYEGLKRNIVAKPR